jgi:MFS family permease
MPTGPQRRQSPTAMTTIDRTAPQDTTIASALRGSDPAVRWLLLGVFVNQLGAFVQVFLVLFLVDQGASDAHAGIALGAYGAGSVLGALLGGRLADRLGRRATMTLSMLCAAVLTISLGFLGDPALYPLLLLVVVADGAMTQAYRPAASAMLADLVPAERLVMTFSMYRVALNTGAVIGPLVAAWLMTVSWDLLFWADGLTAIACALLARRFLPASDGAAASAAADTAAAGQGRAGYGAVLRDGRYLLYLFAMFASAVIYMQYFSVLPLQIRADGHSAAVYSAVLALSAAVVITCELLVTQRVQAWRATSAAAGGIALLGLGLGAYGIEGGLVLLFAATLVGVLGQIVSGPTMFAQPARVAPVAARGSYAGASQAMFGLGAAVGPALGVLAFGALGNGVWAACAAVGALAALAALYGVRDAAPQPAAQPSFRPEPSTTGASS